MRKPLRAIENVGGRDSPRRFAAIPLALVLLVLAAGAATSVFYALRRPHPEATPQTPAIVFVPIPDLIPAPSTEPSSCASTAPPPPVPKKSAPVAPHLRPHPPPPAATIAAPTLEPLPPPPPTAASDIPLSPMKVVPVTPKP